MAPALSGARIRSGSWQGKGVGVVEVQAQLLRLEASLQAEELGQDLEARHPHPRGVGLNLVIVADGPEGSAAVAGITKDIAAHHPARVIILIDRDDDPGRGINAAIDVHAHQLVEGSCIQHERITLEVHGEAGHHLRSVVDPFLIPGVPIYLWWMGDVPFQEERFRSAVGLADAVIVDSAACSSPLECMCDLADLAETGVGLGDFQWIRLGHWRELLAQFFNPPSRRPLLQGVTGLGIDYQAMGGANRGGAALFAGWLQAQLGWTLGRAVIGSEGLLQASFQTAGRLPVEVDLRPVEVAGWLPGEVLAIGLRAIAGARTLDFRTELDQEGEQVEVTFDLDGNTLRQLRSFHTLEAGMLLLSVLLVGGRDTVYRRSLAACAELLRAVR